VDLGLTGQVAVVTGASRGIGLAAVRRLVDEGATVIAGARTESPELKELAAHGAVRTVTVDLSTPTGPADLVAAAGDRVDVLVNNVGSAPARTGGFGAITDEQWSATLTLDLLAAVRACRAVLPLMLAAGKGSIVTVGSINARLSDPMVVDYCAAKAALASFCSSLAKEFAGRGIRVNTVSPGPVATDLWLGADGVAATVAATGGASAEQVVETASQAIPTGRFSRPEEVADAVALLASDRAGNVTGADLRVDGGMLPTW
jgi:NAD(P)-dependent dehydrogenase (short-subunit alcohol dehydrogenase family)